MKNFIVDSLIFSLISYSCFITGMEKDVGIEYRRAICDDIHSITELINTEACKDDDKIVIVPKKFRRSYVVNAIDSGRLFVALLDNKMIGYKKIFCITDHNEGNDILNNELRCKQEALAGYVSISAHCDLSSDELSSVNVTKLRSLPVTYIYNGADFTHPDYRGQGINTQLTRYALSAVAHEVLQQIKHKTSTHLAMVYGLTRFNAGKESDLMDGRTRSIVQAFIPYAQEIAQSLNGNQLSHLIISRYYAFKPSFNPKSSECIPLPDQYSVPGYGYLITCALQDGKGEGHD